MTQFVYDGDGSRVAQIKPDGRAVAYVGNLLEVEYLLPAPPRNLNATAASATWITVTWTDHSTNEDGFQIERSLDGVVWPHSVTVSANTTAYADNSVVCGTIYWYRVRAYNVAGTSAAPVGSVTTPTCSSTPPAAPSNLNPSVVSTQVNLTWTDNSSNETQFEIERLSTGAWSVIATVGADVTSYTDWPCGGQAAQAMTVGGVQPASIPPGATIFYYRVRASNASGYSGYSNTTSVAVVCSIIWDLTTTTASGTMVMTMATPPTGQIWKSYYFAGSQLVALRVEGDPVTTTNGLFFLHGDHLNSTSLTTDASGNSVARQLYDAWGNVRYVTGTLPTDIGYTGQRFDNSTGLMYYQARYYAPGLGRFISADTMVPDGKNPQNLNRFAYTLNNPLRYIDPTGHKVCDERKGCDVPSLESQIAEVRQRRPNAPEEGTILPVKTEDAVRIPDGGEYGANRGSARSPQYHPGADISAIVGKAAYATYDGEVVAVSAQVNRDGEYTGFGKYVVLRHIIDGKIVYSVYAHLSRQAARVGDIVLAGDIVGRTGNTGTAGAHLHFEFRDSTGFNPATGKFIGRYYPPTYEALDASYDSPTGGITLLV